MTPDRLDEMNARLADPPVADALVARHMGLFAVAHLAARHGAVVRLQPAMKGTTAQVWLPAAITADGAAGQVPADGIGIAGPGPTRSGRHLRAGAPAALDPSDHTKAGLPSRTLRGARHAASRQAEDPPRNSPR